jgi:hypothetical protein
MKINGQHYGIAFIFGGTLMAFISYLSNHVSTRWAAILTSVNLSIFIPLFIYRSRNVVNFVWNEIFMALFISIMSLVFYGIYLYSFNKIVSLLSAQLVFILLVYFAYDYILV